jgi:hypothetical protein
MRRLDLLFLDPKLSLFKINKMKNIIIKNSSDRSGGDNGHWSTLARGEVDGGDRQHNTFESGRKWPKLLHMAKKYLKHTKKIRDKNVEDEGERREPTTSSLGARLALNLDGGWKIFQELIF